MFYGENVNNGNSGKLMTAICDKYSHVAWLHSRATHEPESRNVIYVAFNSENTARIPCVDV